jgi:hypothetical protein
VVLIRKAVRQERIIAFLGLLTANSGDWKQGCDLVKSAMQLNPNYPGCA